MYYPWINWDEWKEVYNHLYSTDSNKQRMGVNRAMAWKSKAPNYLSCVEHTASMVNVILSEQESKMNLETISHAYNMLIIKFVNDITEIYKPFVSKVFYTKNKNAKLSTASIALAIDLPSDVLYLRLDTTHKKHFYSSIDTLRIAVFKCLAWLKKNYWEAQSAVLQKENDERERLIKALKTSVYQFYQQKKNYDFDKLKFQCVNLGKSILSEKASIAAFARKLVSEDFLLSHNKNYESYAVHGKKFQLSKEELEFWEDPLTMFFCDVPGFSEQLLLAMVIFVIEARSEKDQSSVNKLTFLRYYAILWYRQVIKMVTTYDEVIPVDPRPIIAKSGKSGKWSVKLLKPLLVFLAPNEAQTLRSIITLFYTQEDIERLKKNLPSKKRKRSYDEVLPAPKKEKINQSFDDWTLLNENVPKIGEVKFDLSLPNELDMLYTKTYEVPSFELIEELRKQQVKNVKTQLIKRKARQIENNNLKNEKIIVKADTDDKNEFTYKQKRIQNKKREQKMIQQKGIEDPEANLTPEEIKKHRRTQLRNKKKQIKASKSTKDYYGKLLSDINDIKKANT